MKSVREQRIGITNREWDELHAERGAAIARAEKAEGERDELWRIIDWMDPSFDSRTRDLALAELKRDDEEAEAEEAATTPEPTEGQR